MTGIGLYIASSAAGLGAYVVGRGVLKFRDGHRSAIRSERTHNVVRLLMPYERELNLIEAEGLGVDCDRRVGHLRAVEAQFDQAG